MTRIKLEKNTTAEKRRWIRYFSLEKTWRRCLMMIQRVLTDKPRHHDKSQPDSLFSGGCYLTMSAHPLHHEVAGLSPSHPLYHSQPIVSFFHCIFAAGKFFRIFHHRLGKEQRKTIAESKKKEKSSNFTGFFSCKSSMVHATRLKWTRRTRRIRLKRFQTKNGRPWPWHIV